MPGLNKYSIIDKTIVLILLSCFQMSFAPAQNTLNDYLQSAIKNSPVLAENRNQQSSLALDSMSFRAGLRPLVNFSAGGQYAPVFNGYGYDEIITNGGNYNALLGVNYTIPGKKYLASKFGEFNLQQQMLELNSKMSERDIRQNITSQFITVYGEQRLLANAQLIINVLTEENLLLKKSAEKGTYRQTDYLSFFVSFKQQQLTYMQQKLQAENDLLLLNYLCGIGDTAYIILADPSVYISNGVNNLKTLQSRQFILDSLKLHFAEEQIRFNYKPKLNLSGDAGYNTTFIYHAEKNFGASVGLNFIIPIYDGNQRKLQVKKIKISENTRLSYADYYKRQLGIKQQQLLSQIHEIENIITEAKDQLKATEALLKANNKLLETGETRITDYILSLTGFISAQVTVQQLITSRMQLINQFNFINN